MNKNEGITIKGALGIYSYMIIFSGLSAFELPDLDNPPSDMTIENTLFKINSPKFDFSESVKVVSSTETAGEDAEILYDFIASIISETKPLESDISEFISKNIWNLL